MFDLGTSFAASVERDPEGLGIVDADVQLTYREWYGKISALVAAFDDLGLRAGDHLVTVLQNRWEAATIHWACQFAGIIITPLNRAHFKATDDADAKLACFSTSPNIRNLPQAFFCETIGTFLLILPVFLMTDAKFELPGTSGDSSPVTLGLGALGALPVGLLVFAIGLSLGGTTGYAINPARVIVRELPMLCCPFRESVAAIGRTTWIPVAGPLLGAVLAAWVHSLIK